MFLKNLTYLVFILSAFFANTSCSTRITRPGSPNNAEYLLQEYVSTPRIPLRVDHYYSPKPAKLERGNWLTYEIHVGNYYTTNIVLAGVEVLTDTVSKNYLYRITGDSLKPHFKNLTYAPDSIKMILKPGEQGIIFFLIPLADHLPIPTKLYHRFLVEIQGKKMSLLTRSIQVENTTPVVLSPPLKGLWMVAQGVDPQVKSTEGHNRLLYPQSGVIKMPQRFSSDWVKIGVNKKVFHGDSSKNENYYGYGAEVYAVADGVITEIQNDVPENIPPNMTVPRTAKNVIGNYVLLKMKNGKTAFYGHLQTGSIQVKPGTHVKSGQLIAKVGNTGNSTGAHLHFQVQDGAHFFDEGYPFTFSGITRYGRATKQQVDDMADRGGIYPGEFEQIELKNVLPVFGDIIMFK